MVSAAIAPMKSVTVSFKSDLEDPSTMAASCIKLSYFTSFSIKAKCKCCIAHDTLLRSRQIQPVSISRLACSIHITKHPTFTQTSKKLKKTEAQAGPTCGCSGGTGCLGFSSVAVTDLLSDLGNVFVP